MGALVHGWKEKGEWPPRQQQAAENTSQAGPKREARSGAERGDGKVLGKSSALAKRGVGRMKKVLGLGAELGRSPTGEGD